MAWLDMEPFFTLECAWEDKNLPDLVKFEHTYNKDKRHKGKVTPDSGQYGIDYTLAVTLTKFKDLQKDFGYTGSAMWREWHRCLKGTRQVAWDNLLASDYANENRQNVSTWKTAINKWLKKITNCDKTQGCTTTLPGR